MSPNKTLTAAVQGCLLKEESKRFLAQQMQPFSIYSPAGNPTWNNTTNVIYKLTTRAGLLQASSATVNWTSRVTSGWRRKCEPRLGSAARSPVWHPMSWKVHPEGLWLEVWDPSLRMGCMGGKDMLTGGHPLPRGHPAVTGGILGWGDARGS